MCVTTPPISELGTFRSNTVDVADVVVHKGLFAKKTSMSSTPDVGQLAAAAKAYSSTARPAY